MPRIVGVDIPDNKAIWVVLDVRAGNRPVDGGTDPQGARVESTTKANKLSEDELSRITQIIDRNYVVEGQLRRQVAQNIARLRDIGCYRGMRHRRGLPVRGQRTQTNARTRKGPRKTVAGKKGVKECTITMAKGRQERKITKESSSRGDRPHQGDVQQHDDHDHRHQGRRDLLGSGRHVGFKGSRKSTPFAGQLAAQKCADKAMQVRREGSGREGQGARQRPGVRDHRPAGGRAEDQVDRRRDAAAAQRLPAAKASTRVTRVPRALKEIEVEYGTLCSVHRVGCAAARE